MASQRTKRILLAVLLVILLYVWWGNLKLFFPPSPVPQEVPRSGTVSVGSDTQAHLVYREPRINPFLRPRTDDVSKQSKSPVPRPGPSVALVSGSYTLSGIVTKGATSQAVIRTDQDSTFILATGDSLVGWRVVEITSNRVVFSHEKLRDTLRLEGLE